MDGLIPWLCANGHVLGYTKRTKSEGFHISQLVLLRHALDQQGKLEPVDVLATIEGATLDAVCDVPGCGARRTWNFGADVARKVKKLYVAE
mgnify:CR=1 FL=1